MIQFDKKNISPMLLEETTPFNDKDYLYELKLDGTRCIAYLDEAGTILKNKRQKVLNDAFPELTSLNKNVNKRCILDGEIICMKNGKPSFYTLQERGLLTDKIKIKYQSIKNPASFVAYDILFVGNEDITSYPLLKRKEILNETVTESDHLAISRYIFEKGIEFFNEVKKNDLEGIVAKKKDSIYSVNKRSSSWLKIKVMQEIDALIAGYCLNEKDEIKSLILVNKISPNNYEYVTTVHSGYTKQEQVLIKKTAAKHPSDPLILNKDDGETVWMKPTLIGVVKYMMKTTKGGLRQPVFKGLKLD